MQDSASADGFILRGQRLDHGLFQRPIVNCKNQAPQQFANDRLALCDEFFRVAAARCQPNFDFAYARAIANFQSAFDERF